MMPDSEDFVVFMKLKFGVDETIIPGVLASRGIPVFLTERYMARQGQYVEIKVPAERLEDARRALEDAKRVGDLMDQESDEG
jgi:hypothetical protein